MKNLMIRDALERLEQARFCMALLAADRSGGARADSDAGAAAVTQAEWMLQTPMCDWHRERFATVDRLQDNSP